MFGAISSLRSRSYQWVLSDSALHGHQFDCEDSSYRRDSVTKRMHLLVDGRVQGVCYRMYAQDQASGLGVTGWVKNLPDGRVEIVAEGDDESLNSLAGWCRTGPSMAMVTGIEMDQSEATGAFDSFSIKSR